MIATVNEQDFVSRGARGNAIQRDVPTRAANGNRTGTGAGTNVHRAGARARVDVGRLIVARVDVDAT